MLYGTIMSLACSASRLPNYCSVSAIVNAICLEVLTTYCLRILDALGAILMAHEVQITKSEISVSVCRLECTDTRGSGREGYFPHMLNEMNFWTMNSILKELCCLSEDP